jgi:ParB family chromosome partitioning protein
MTPADGKKGLGRGLSALLGTPGATAAPEPQRAQRNVPVAKIRPGAFQPRRDFAPEALKELTESIREHGVLQPVLLRRDPNDPSGYELIAGERRWRAAQAAQLHEIPAVVKDLSDSEAMAAALVENLQRADLNAIEEANALKRLVDDLGYTQDRVAQAIGKSRPYVANALRLLEVDPRIQALVVDGSLSAAHARLTLSVKAPWSFAVEIVDKALSVRQAEKMMWAERHGHGEAAKKKLKRPPTGVTRDADTRAIERRLTEALGLKVELKPRKGGAGELVLHYGSLDQFDDLLARLERERE